MKVLLGVCGLGQGHSSRQSVILDYFKSRNDRVHLFTYGASSNYFAQHHPDITQSKVFVPWIECDHEGINYEATSNHVVNRKHIDVSINYQAMDTSIKALEGIPELVLSDYEPISAQFSYAIDCPLITLDQQSKFIGFSTPNIGSFSANEERSRLRMFFPRADLRLASSWYPLDQYPKTRHKVTLVAPILRKEITNYCCDKNSQTGTVLVYWSPYYNDEDQIEDLIEALRYNCHTQFNLFVSNFIIKKYITKIPTNVTFHSYNKKPFIGMLYSAKAVITTAGHQILAECAFLRKKVYCIPFSTYEQQFNAAKVQEHNLGISVSNINGKHLKWFLDEWLLNNDRSTNSRNIIFNEYPSIFEKINNMLQ